MFFNNKNFYLGVFSIKKSAYLTYLLASLKDCPVANLAEYPSFFISGYPATKSVFSDTGAVQIILDYPVGG